MYQPEQFREDRLELQHEFVRANPLGLLVCLGSAGLEANPVPFTLYPDEGRLGTLRCHLSRANEQWQALSSAEECLVAFLGPHAYVSPSWYATKRESGKVVPTWNYVTVHAWGRPLVTHDPAWLRRQIDDLTEAHEARFPESWTVADAPASFVAAQLKGIVGIEIPIDRSQGKWKMSQNRQHADREGVIAGLASGTNGDAAVSEVMKSLRDLPPD